MNKYYERMKMIVEKDVGEIPKIITSDWLLKKYNEDSAFKFWFFTFSDLRGHKFDENIPYELKRFIGFSTKTIMDDDSYLKITKEMFKPDKEIVKLQEEGYDGEGMEVAVIDYGYEQLHDEIKDELVSYVKMRDTKPNFHGTAVASYLCGKNIGVVPKAKLHFYKIVEGAQMTVKDMADDVIKSLEDIYEKNNQGSNIKVVNISSPWHRKDERFVPIKEKLANQGCFVIDSIDYWKNYTPIHIDHSTNEYYYGLWQNKELEKYKNMIAIPTGNIIPLHETVNDYKYESEVNVSWSIPVLSGLFTMALQINPNLTFDEFNEIAISNKKIDSEGRTLFDIEKTFSIIKEMNKSIKL